MSIYTKTGDKGKTGLFFNDKGKKIRVSKSSTIIETLGTIDEANSFLGLSASFLAEQYLKNKITQVQRTLFTLASIIAGAKISIPKLVVTKYEKEIDKWTALMPPLTNFIFPGGSKSASFIFTARAFVRRAERCIVSLPNVNPNILVYINRLSDYLFTLARYVNFREGLKEKAWSRK